MNQATSIGKAATQTKSVSQADSSVGQNALSMAPPDYGIDFVDSDQAVAAPLQRASGQLIQAISKPELVAQRQAAEEEEEEEDVLQGIFTSSEESVHFHGETGKTDSCTGISGPLRTSLEALSGMDLSGVKIHKNSSKPARLNALAYTQGQDIHVGPGKEKHLPHEGWHAVQQMQRRVKPTTQILGVSINDDAGLEREADMMGTKALQTIRTEQETKESAPPGAVPVQRFEAREHKSMGDKGSGGTKMNLPGGLKVTFGEITALAGDYFGSVPQIQKLAGVNGDGKTAGTRDEVEFALYVKVRKSKKAKDFGQEVKDAVEERYYRLAGTNVTHFTEPGKGDSGRSFDQLASARGVVPKRAAKAYGVAKGTKVPVNNAGSYRANHLAAIRTAAVAGAAGKPIDKAMLYEAFSSHFLTDAYAAGHVRTPRAAISKWWNPKVPMFWTNLQLWMAERIAKHMNDHSVAGYVKTVQQLYEAAQETLDEVASKIPALSFGDAVSGAMHDIDNTQGVMAQVGNDVVKLVGDGQVIDSKDRELVNGVETAKKAAAGVKVSLKDVKTAYAMGKAGSDLNAILAALRLPDGLFRAEQLWPRALPGSDPRQTNAALKWKADKVEDLFKDPDMRKALTHFAHEKADTLGSAINLKPPLKADKEAALREAVLARLKADEAAVIATFREIINYTPGSATGETGGVFGHDKDDDALSYYRKAKAKNALHTLTLNQRTRLVRLVLEGATVGAEDTMVADLLVSSKTHAPAVVKAVGWRWIWSDLSGGDLEQVVDGVGPAFWGTQSLNAKKREVKYLADGWTSDISQRLIIVILRTCSGPKEVRAVNKHVGWPGLNWDLSGRYQDEFDRLKE